MVNSRHCVNPSNHDFQIVLNCDYVDKSLLLDLLNSSINTTERFICVSSFRRSGKSFACSMINAYYSKDCNSKEQFSKLKIFKTDNFAKYLNQFNVIYLDIKSLVDRATDEHDVVEVIKLTITKELQGTFSTLFEKGKNYNVYDALKLVCACTSTKFVGIIDDFDYIFRKMPYDFALQDKYMELLRNLFKSTYTSDCFALAYMTGIFSVSRSANQSSLNNVMQYNMLSPSRYGPFLAFTNDEVKVICRDYGFDYDKVRRWYGGYQLGDIESYNPDALMGLILNNGQFGSFFSESKTNGLSVALDKKFEDLKDKIIALLNGHKVRVDSTSFENNLESLNNTDAVLVYLVLLGYLGFDEVTSSVYVPNESIRRVLYREITSRKWPEYLKEYQRSQEFLDNVYLKNTDVVSNEIQSIHQEMANLWNYNNGSTLKNTILTAFAACIDKYQSPRLELPSGKGFADVVYIPKDEFKVDEIPALIIELKLNKVSIQALEQIKERDYVSKIKAFVNWAFLVGINYDEKTKEHSCEIEDVEF